MKNFLDSIKKRFDASQNTSLSEEEGEYVQVDTASQKAGSSKVIVRPFVLDNFNDSKTILDALRSQDTICLINIQPLKDKDVVELKRAINKLKKTVDAIGGDIAGFGDDYIVVTPGFATIYRAPATKAEDEE